MKITRDVLIKEFRRYWSAAKTLFEIVVGVLLTALLVTTATHLAPFAEYFGPNDLSQMILLAAVALYLVRRFLPLAYGLSEIIIGTMVIFNAVARSQQAADIQAIADQLVVQVAGGIYLIVRGIDNFVRSRLYGELAASIKGMWMLFRSKA